MPPRLFTREMYEACARTMADARSILAVHILGAHAGEAALSVARTLACVFPHVEACRSGPEGGVCFFASASPLVALRSDLFSRKFGIAEALLELDGSGGAVYTDEEASEAFRTTASGAARKEKP